MLLPEISLNSNTSSTPYSIYYESLSSSFSAINIPLHLIIWISFGFSHNSSPINLSKSILSKGYEVDKLI